MFHRIIIGILVLLLLPVHPVRSQASCTCGEWAKSQRRYPDDSAAAAALLRTRSVICEAKAWQLLGEHFLDKNEPDSAEYFLQKAEKAYKQSGCGDSLLLTTYKNMAQLFYTRARYDKAQEYCFNMLKAAEAGGQLFEQAKAFTMIAQVFNQTEQAGTGIIYTQKAAALYPRITRRDQQKELAFLLSKRYLWHFQDTKTGSSLDSSEWYSRTGIVLARRDRDSAGLANAYINLQGVEWEKGRLPQAIRYLDTALLYTSKTLYHQQATMYFDRADILIELGDYPGARSNADSSLKYQLLLGGNPAFLADLYALMARIGRLRGDYKTAYEFREKETAITDSIRSTQKSQAVAELERKYNQAKNENTIKDLARKKQRYLLLSIAGLLGITATGFFLRQQSLSHKKKILETEQRLNRARMNPHFFFNALAALQKFAVQENNPQALASHLARFSHIMRETLESTYKEYITIEQEMEFLEEYLQVQTIRFPQAFTFEITADPELEPDECQIPSMIIQPFVENSIEHGFAGISYAGHIQIAFKKGRHELQIFIRDNGRGLPVPKSGSPAHTSRASQIIEDRLYLLNLKLKTRAAFRIGNNEGASGVTVEIHLPLLYKDLTPV